MQEYDHVIVGTGQATSTLLSKLIPSGDSIAVIEGHHVGGSCVNYGCTPTKSLVASAKAIHTASRGEVYGFSLDSLHLDYEMVRKRMNEIRAESNEGLIEWMESTENVDLIRGFAEFFGPKALRIGDREVFGERIYLNVGTHAFLPPIDGIADSPWMDSEGLLDLDELPEHLVIIGGGYVGVEFAQIYRRFGSMVTLIQSGEQIMPQEDEDVASEVKSILEDEGIRVMCKTRAKRVSVEGKQIRVVVASNDGTEEIYGTHLLVATGRRPNSKRLNLEKAGIETDEKGYIKVDEQCRTNLKGVFAVGDVNGHGAFTHTAVNDAEIVLDLLFGGGNRKISDRIPVYALFTDPPLGRVGLSEKEALKKGYRVLKSKKAMKEISRAKEMSETKGFAKLLVDADTDRILGASVLGPGGDEIINMFAAIMHSGVPCREYRRVVLVHPTVSELMPFVLDGLEAADQSD